MHAVDVVAIAVARSAAESLLPSVGSVTTAAVVIVEVVVVGATMLAVDEIDDDDDEVGEDDVSDGDGDKAGENCRR
jgi:hypothetical protein